MTQASEFRCLRSSTRLHTRTTTTNGQRLIEQKVFKRGLQYKCHCGEWTHYAQIDIRNKIFHSPSTIPPISKTATTKETIPQNLIKTAIADVDNTQPGRIVIGTEYGIFTPYSTDAQGYNGLIQSKKAKHGYTATSTAFSLYDYPIFQRHRIFEKYGDIMFYFLFFCFFPYIFKIILNVTTSGVE